MGSHARDWLRLQEDDPNLLANGIFVGITCKYFLDARNSTACNAHLGQLVVKELNDRQTGLTELMAWCLSDM